MWKITEKSKEYIANSRYSAICIHIFSSGATWGMLHSHMKDGAVGKVLEIWHQITHFIHSYCDLSYLRMTLWKCWNTQSCHWTYLKYEVIMLFMIWHRLWFITLSIHCLLFTVSSFFTHVQGIGDNLCLYLQCAQGNSFTCRLSIDFLNVLIRIFSYSDLVF